MKYDGFCCHGLEQTTPVDPHVQSLVPLDRLLPAVLVQRSYLGGRLRGGEFVDLVQKVGLCVHGLPQEPQLDADRGEIFVGEAGLPPRCYPGLLPAQDWLG